MCVCWHIQGNDWHTAEFASGYLTTALSILPMLDSLAAVATAGQPATADQGDKADKAGDPLVPPTTPTTPTTPSVGDGSFYAPSYNIFAKVRVPTTRVVLESCTRHEDYTKTYTKTYFFAPVLHTTVLQSVRNVPAMSWTHY